MFTLIFSLGAVVVAMFLIKYACDYFESNADYLGRNMSPGIKGATINAIGSSMPELLTGMAFLFTVTHLGAAEAFLSAVAVTAGSAIFNAVIIPAMVILAVTVWGVKTNGVRVRIPSISLEKHTVWRDGVFLVGAELILIYFLGFEVISWWTGLILIATYAVYFGYLMWQNEGGEDDDDVDEDIESYGLTTWMSKKWFPGATTSFKAWINLSIAVGILAISCHILAEAIVQASLAIDVPVYFMSVILAAAATSVPDTFLSVKDSLKGNYDDAVSNALGSNIFDITICTGLPILLFTLIYGAISMSGMEALEHDVQVLRVILVGITLAIMALFLIGKKIGTYKAIAMLLLYVGWIAWIGYSI